MQSNSPSLQHTIFIHFFNVAVWREVSHFVEDVNKPRKTFFLFVKLDMVGIQLKKSPPKLVRSNNINCDGQI